MKLKSKKWVVPLIMFLVINLVGLFRFSIISNNEIKIGRLTMTGVFTFMAYFFIAILVSLICLIILKINSIREEILNRVVKNIFIVALVIIFIPVIVGVFIFFH